MERCCWELHATQPALPPFGFFFSLLYPNRMHNAGRIAEENFPVVCAGMELPFAAAALSRCVGGLLIAHWRSGCRQTALAQRRGFLFPSLRPQRGG